MRFGLCHKGKRNLLLLRQQGLIKTVWEESIPSSSSSTTTTTRYSKGKVNTPFFWESLKREAKPKYHHQHHHQHLSVFYSLTGSNHQSIHHVVSTYSTHFITFNIKFSHYEPFNYKSYQRNPETSQPFFQPKPQPQYQRQQHKT